MKVLVTGGAGFIGSHIVEGLLKEGYQVRVLDNLSTGKPENLAGVWSEIEFIQGSLEDYTTVREAVEGVDYISHQGALPSVPRSLVDPLATHSACVTGTLNLLQAAREVGVQRVVYAASSSCYGDRPGMPRREEMLPAPLSPYAAAKLAGEYYCYAFWKSFGLETVCLRYFNIFGPRQDPQSPYAAVIPKFIQALLKDQPLPVYGDGKQTRDFTYVENVVFANLRALVAKEAPGESLNIACGESYSLLELIQYLEQWTGKQAKIEYLPPRPGDVRHSLADISRARSVLGYKVVVPFKEGLRRTLEWHIDRLYGQNS